MQLKATPLPVAIHLFSGYIILMNVYKRILKYYILLLFILFFTPAVSSADETNKPIFKITDISSTLPLNRYFSYTRDRYGTAKYTDMISRTSSFLQHIEDSPLILGYSSDAIWLKMDIVNPGTNSRDWILEYRYPLIDNITLYIITNAGVKIMESGDSFPGKNRIIKSRTFAFPVNSPPGKSTIMARIKSDGSLNINIQAWNSEEFNEYIHRDQLFQGVFLGIMFSLLIYNLIIFFFARHHSYIYLALYITTISLYSLANNGFAPVYIWPDSAILSQVAHPVLIFMSIASIYLFTCSFLSLKMHYPVLFKTAMAIIAMATLCIPLTFKVPYRYITQSSVLMTFFSVFFLTAIGIISLRTSRRQALYYIGSYVSFGAGSLLLAFRAYGSSHETFYEVWGMQTGATLMVLLLSLGVADMIRSLLKEKEKALDAMKESETRLQILFSNAHDGIIVQRYGRIMFVNKAIRKMTGYTTAELRKSDPDRIIIKTDTESRDPLGISYRYSGILKNRDGEAIDVIISVAEATIDGEPAQMLIITDVSMLKNAEATITRQYEEIESQYEEMAALNIELSNNHTEILEANEKLGREKEQLAAIIKSITEAVTVIDTEGIITLVNSETERLTDLPGDEITGKNFNDLFIFNCYNNRAVCPDPAGKLIDDQKTITYENPVIFTNRNGTEYILELTGNPVIADGQLYGAIITLHDITQKYRLEQEILRVRKIDSLSVLAGGLAHDFNNLLTAILGNISIARHSSSDTGEYNDLLDKIEQAAAKATGLTRQLLTFSKGGAPVKRPESIKQLLQSDVDFMLAGSKIKGIVEIADDLLNVEVDINQFSQVIQNLIINAIQAMPDSGTLRITAHNVSDISSLPLKPGQYVKISVIDTGSGIPEENLDKIFDPYFTTKTSGSGLGLASCYSIIKRHGGYINVKSAPGRGSSFNIYIPATDNKPEDLADVCLRYDFSGYTVLLMDDDPAVREVAERMLRSLKLLVTSCSSGEEAIALYKKNFNENNTFDLFITDLVIPGSIGGDTVFKIIRETDPGVNGIAISGYANDPVLSNYSSYGFAACLSKPFEINSLAAVLSRVLPSRS